jgi:FkbM family methyltransferase
MAVGGVPLILLKNFLYHCLCLGSESRYFALKANAMRCAARLGAYEAGYIRRLRFFVRPGSDVVDVGANVGAYTTAISRLTGPAGRVFAFEPLPTAADVLERKCARLKNVLVLRQALSSGEGVQDTLDLHVPLLAGGVPEPALAALAPAPWVDTGLKTWRVFRVPVRRLDDHLASFRDLSFVKVDVEGQETGFLKGAIESVRRFRPVLQLESSGLQADVASTERWMRDARYMLISVRGDRLDIGGEGGSRDLNVYAVPEEFSDRFRAVLVSLSSRSGAHEVVAADGN